MLEARAGAELAATSRCRFRAAGDGETVSGIFTGTVQLTSGMFAFVEKSHEFTLVPWRPVIDRPLGREVEGIGFLGSLARRGGWDCNGTCSSALLPPSRSRPVSTRLAHLPRRR